MVPATAKRITPSSDSAIHLELGFPLLGKSLPVDNGYPFFVAISRFFDGHLPPEVSLMSVSGYVVPGTREILIDHDALFRLRVPAGNDGSLFKLAGKALSVGGHDVRLGIPSVWILRAAPNLYSRIVTIQGFLEPEPFLEAVRRQMAAIGVQGDAEIAGPKRSIQIKGKYASGYPVRIRSLSAEGSLRLLAHGLGGRRHFGAGVFVPTPEVPRVST
jgi:CRISPR-associated protein Cas6